MPATALLSPGLPEFIFEVMTHGRITLALKAAVLVGFVTFLLRSADLGMIAGHIGRIPYYIFAAGLALTLSGLVLQTIRWRLLLQDPSISFRECLAFVGLGASLNMVSPSSVVSDGTIGYWMGKRSANVLGALSTLFAARLVGTLSAILLFLGALTSHLWIFERVPLEWSPRKALYAGAAGIALIVVFLVARRHRDKLRDLGRRALPAMRDPKTLALVLLLSMAIQAIQFLVFYLGFRAVGAPVRLIDVFFFAPLITFLGMIPISIGGIGVREGLGVFFYTLLPGVIREAVLSQAGYVYILLVGAALCNLTFAALVLGIHGGEPRPEERATEEAEEVEKVAGREDGSAAPGRNPELPETRLVPERGEGGRVGGHGEIHGQPVGRLAGRVIENDQALH